MLTRRSFLQSTAAIGAATVAFRPGRLRAVAAASASVADQSPAAVASDESYWGEIQQAFELDRTLINLNTGHHCSSPKVVRDSVDRFLDMENLAPVFYAGQIGSRIEVVRRELADEFGCDAEELAITRNASESLQILQNGMDLAAGDEVITTEQDYPRMLTTWDQRMRRDKIKVTRLQFPVPTTADDLYGRFEAAITPSTRVFHFCHITNLTGQLFPVQRLSRLARSKGITTIVDGAHAGAHFPFTFKDLDCDTYSVSLHKWLLAPLGSGILVVRKNLIPKFWPLQAAPATSNDNIRKFEEIGTHPAACHNAVSTALAFHRSIGSDRKVARLRYLRDRWAKPLLAADPRVTVWTPLGPGAASAGIGLVQLKGIDSARLSECLWNKHQIVTVPIPHPQFEGVRVTPNLYTTPGEIDVFVAAMKQALKLGV
jgi:selenocysteine lyase/cysteine desulfurase